MSEEMGKGPWAKAEVPKDSKTIFKETVDRLFRENKKAPGTLDPDFDSMLVFARYFLNHPYAEFHEEYEIDSAGGLKAMTKADVSIEYWAQAKDAKITAENIRAAAVKIQEFFPQLQFSFAEDRTRRRFSYTAILA